MATAFVADDNPLVHRIIRDTLAPDGHEVVSLGDDPDVREAIVRARPAIVFLGSRLGGRDALDLCRELLDVASLNATRFVLLAGPLESVDTAKASAAGCWSVLQKPIDPGTLAACLDPPTKRDRAPEPARSEPPSVDQLVRSALHSQSDAERGDAAALRDAIREHVQTAITAAMPSLIDRITDRLAASLERR